MTFISYSQNLEDVMLWRALQTVEAGFYIDIGAWDPYLDSVTLAFYQRGWRGINVEPDAEKHVALSAARPRDINLQCAVSNEAGTHLFHDVLKTGLSTLDAAIAKRHQDAGQTVVERTVEVRTLADICTQHVTGEVNFLKIDVEGLETAVIAGADFARFRPWIILVEATEPNSSMASYSEWEPILTQAGYGLVYCDGLNRYYVADERSVALAAAFAMPPNVFDDYVSDAGVRKAFETQTSGEPIAALQAILVERQAAEARAAAAVAERESMMLRAAALDAALRKATVAREEAELHALAARRDAELAHADAEQATAAQSASPKSAALDDLDPIVKGQQRLYYDASLIIRFGFETPVGLIRAEHYVAEFLVLAPLIDIRFVVFELELRSYRALTRVETALLHKILFNRYERAAPAPDIAWELKPAENGPAMNERLNLVHVPDRDALMSTPASVDPAFPSRERFTAGLLFRRIRTATTLTSDDYNTMLDRYAMHLMPVRHGHSPFRRLATRTLRRAGLHAARAAHDVVRPVTKVTRNVLSIGRHAMRPDNPPPTVAIEAATMVIHDHLPPVMQPATPTLPDTEHQEPADDRFRFSRGSVLLSLGNSWDYLDYDYLHRVCKQDGVRFISVLYDVIAMEFPFSSPSPPHIYHRHWVEIGHCATSLLAISKFTADQYSKFIAEPNDLRPHLTYAHLPSFLWQRSDEIGSTPVASLAGRKFVIFCSTIETRKNHQLLLHLWDRLREVFDAEELPILVFVGKWGWGTETVRLLSERNYRLRSHLKILDRVSDAELIWLYRNARFTVFPALSEGFGLAAAESLSFGTPVVVANCPALVEATEGLMPALDPLDIVSWFREMQALIRDDRQLETLRAAASRYRGPVYEAFAETICQLALADPETALQGLGNEQCPAV